MATKKIISKILRYTAVFEPCEEGGFVVTIPKMPGVVTEGDTFEEAVKMAQDAVEGYLKVLSESDENIPEPDEKSFTTTIDINASRIGISP